MKRIALVGNPNSGKSTLFNNLTGSTQFVGNWPGVTVEKKEGKTKIGNESVQVIDLPGIYSLSPYSKEEVISRDYILNEKPDIVIDIVDASNLERNLYLTTQVIELGVPVVVALNMIDVVKKKGEELSAKALSDKLGCPVCEIAAVSGKGVKEMKKVVADVISGTAKITAHEFTYPDDVRAAIDSVKAKYEEETKTAINDFTALKILGKDENMLAAYTPSEDIMATVKTLVDSIEAKHDDDFESVVAEGRYTWIKSIIGSVILTKRKEKLSVSDKIDKVITNRWLALPIFFAIIYAIYWVCLNPKGLGKYLVGLTFGGLIKVMIWAQGLLEGWGVWAWLTDMVVNGVIFGVGIVVAFVPYLMVLFFFLALLEECGYMARVTFIMDRVFRRFGLSGKSFIPMLLGTGCTVQAIASARTIEDEQDRKMTIYLTSFIPCATMMPTIILIVGLFTQKAWVAPLTYLVSIGFVILGGIFLKHTFMKGKPAPFVMELPEYKIPRPKNVWHFIWDRTVSFFKKASTIILVTSVIVWFLQNFTFSFHYLAVGANIAEHPDVMDGSMLAYIGRFLSPLFAPMGVTDWRIIAALITCFVAKDKFIGTLGQVFGVAAMDAAILGELHVFTPASAISFLMFFVLSSPCFASMGAMRKELGSRKEAAKAILFQMTTAYVVAVVTYLILNPILNGLG